LSAPDTLCLPPGVQRTVVAGLAALATVGGGLGQPVVLIPGFTGSKEDFLPVLAPLAVAGYRAVAIDQRGQYESPADDDPASYSVAALAADARAVLDAVGAGFRGTHLVGHSFGGLVARGAALQSPAGIASLTLLGSGPAALGGPRGAHLQAMRTVLDRGGVPAVWAATEALSALDHRKALLPADVQTFLRTRFLAQRPLALRAMGDALLDEPDRVAQLRAVGLPMLVAHGEGDDAWSPAEQRDMAERLGARYASIPGALHSPAAEAPGATVAVLVAFWATLDRPHRAGPAEAAEATAGA